PDRRAPARNQPRAHGRGGRARHGVRARPRCQGDMPARGLGPRRGHDRPGVAERPRRRGVSGALMMGFGFGPTVPRALLPPPERGRSARSAGWGSMTGGNTITQCVTPTPTLPLSGGGSERPCPPDGLDNRLSRHDTVLYGGAG